MNKRLCHDRECKLGWGYNESLDRLIPVEGEPPNVTSEAANEWKYSVVDLEKFGISDIYNLSACGHHEWITLFLGQAIKLLLDFEIIAEDNEYWQVHCFFIERKKSCEEFSTYPLNCSHFVHSISYGVHLRIQFPKTGFSENEKEIETLFEERNFNEMQKKIKCRVLINAEKREMILEELLEFMEEINENKHPQYNGPILFDYDKLDQEIKETVIDNEEEFSEFFSVLYIFYQIIEVKMKKADYPDILPDLESKEKSLARICVDLEKAKEEYKLMDKDNFLKMYSVVKKLYFRYVDYFRKSIDLSNDMDEGNYLPGTASEMASWITKLKTWFPATVNGEWINCMNSFVGSPPGYEQVVETLCETVEFSDIQVINDNEATEPYIKDKNNKVLFGFVDMEGARKDESSDNSSLLELECPRECTQDLRKWICTLCGDYVEIKLNPVGWQFLLCSCGSKRYKDKLLICHHPSHRQQGSNSSSDVNKIQNKTFINKDLASICGQLQKIHIKNKEATDPKILNAVIHLLSKNKTEEEIKSALRDLQDVVLDGDTKHLIDQYLNKQN